MKSNGVFINVGANIGTTLLYAMQSGQFGSALAFEPEPRNFKLLKANIAVNELTAVKPIRAALSDKAGMLEFELSQSNFGNHRLVQAGLSDGRRPSTVVPAMRMDSALAEHGIVPRDVSLLWLDTQGHELSVLEGAVGLLEVGVPTVIEFSAYEFRKNGTLERLERLLTNFYGSFIDLSDPNLSERASADIPLISAKSVKKSEHTDLLLLPKNG
jgi:FkbM family methyltransferase